ncbi:hypothetical protein [Microbacterium sp. NIBRBAC000506063]|nr:hypothetical protein [Microbacterium sp. NIBRBAC000506063]
MTTILGISLTGRTVLLVGGATSRRVARTTSSPTARGSRSSPRC